jgi:hypothetical protein
VPTLHAEEGYAFEMVMRDCLERPHVHVRGNGRGGAKLWLEPAIGMASPGRYNDHQLGGIRRIIRVNLAKLIGKWDEECARVQDEGGAR